MADDPFSVLGVACGASSDEITQAYRALAQIYHPDRYADAPARVQSEANRRMQAVNVAYEQVRAAGGHSARPGREPTAAARRPSAPAFVYYVDGSKGYHSGALAPLGFGSVNGELQRVSDAVRCPKLDSELEAWFELQRRNASVAVQQMYATWDAEAQALYSARLGCSRVARDQLDVLGVPCGQCRP